MAMDHPVCCDYEPSVSLESGSSGILCLQITLYHVAMDHPVFFDYRSPCTLYPLTMDHPVSFLQLKVHRLIQQLI